MARSTSDIFKELDAFFSPSAKIIKQQKALIPGQIATATAGLETRKENEFRDITSRANARNMVYSGMPIEEETRYTGEQFLPALAGLKSAGQEQTLSLAESLAGLRREQGLMAQGLRQGELDRDAAERQARRAAAAAARAAANPTFATPTQPDQGVVDLPGVGLKNKKLGGQGGFSFNIAGNPASAFSYAQKNQINLADLLYSMGAQGDKYAADAYKIIASNNGQVTPQIRQKFSSLFWTPQAQGGFNTAPSTGTLMPSLPGFGG